MFVNKVLIQGGSSCYDGLYCSVDQILPLSIFFSLLLPNWWRQKAIKVQYWILPEFFVLFYFFWFCCEELLR